MSDIVIVSAVRTAVGTARKGTLANTLILVMADNARAFGHATHYVATERDGVLTGVLPLARVRTLLFGDSLISVPFCVNGGPLAADAERFAALVAAAHAQADAARITGAHSLTRQSWLIRSPISSTTNSSG